MDATRDKRQIDEIIRPERFHYFLSLFHDKSLNDPFFNDVFAKCNIFKANFIMLKPPSQAEIMFIANKKLLNIIIHPKYFHPND
jgi:hypothetical protein